jgi:hypothetical protein
MKLTKNKRNTLQEKSEEKDDEDGITKKRKEK